MSIQGLPITFNTSVSDLLLAAQSEVNNLTTDEIFIVKDLFRGYEWNRILVANRTKLGSRFLAYAQGDGSIHLEVLDKTPQNQQRYKKK